MNVRKTFLLTAPLLLLAATAHAGPLGFNLTVSGVDTGNITITETAGLIGTISGTFDGQNIIGLLPTGSIGINDNLYYTTAPYFDGGGVSFQLAGLDTKGYAFVNLSWNTIQSAYFAEQSPTSANTGGVAFGPDTITSAAVPEPGSAGLILVAAGLAFAVRKRLASK